jgi:hypothetical protein
MGLIMASAAAKDKEKSMKSPEPRKVARNCELRIGPVRVDFRMAIADCRMAEISAICNLQSPF